MKLSPHTIDVGYRFSSNNLKACFDNDIQIVSKVCADLPCGNGRNSFFLSEIFEEVHAIDVSLDYLNEILSVSNAYKNASRIRVLQCDLVQQVPDIVSKCDFLSCIHFYSFSAISNIIARMKPNAYLFVESPSCHRGNAYELPTKLQLRLLFKGMQVVHLHERECNLKVENQEKVAFNCLLKK